MRKKTEPFLLKLFEKYLENPELEAGLRGGIKIIYVDPKGGNYPILCDNGKRYSIRGKCCDGGDPLVIEVNRENPIKDQRIINDFTFATRLKDFLSNIQVNDPCSEEELDYLKFVANELLVWQRETATEDYELKYLEMTKK